MKSNICEYNFSQQTWTECLSLYQTSDTTDKEETFVVTTKLQKLFFTMVYNLSSYVLQLLSR